ncbi:indolethylamine N-methyltransferase-like [Phyllobates terribilis]|uniref:indolethylamine N-methyltransferase-like n=1 Tax=Phyllobates terribilis TaxID=111132 RepID=UPI003CCAA4BD
MDSCPSKCYHVDSFDSRQNLETYFSNKPDMVLAEDSLKFPLENLFKTFKEGHINGDILIDISPSAMIHHLFAACEFFKHIIVLKSRDRCILELKRWADERTGAFDWSHATKLHADIGKSSDLSQDNEGKVRCCLQHVVKCNIEKENITDPIILPLGDCIISTWLLDIICQNGDDYVRYLQKFSRLLKPEGHLILLGVLDATYFTVGKDKFQYFTYDEDFARKSVVEAGFVIDRCVVKKRTVVCDLIDHKAVIFIAAHKAKSE